MKRAWVVATAALDIVTEGALNASTVFESPFMIAAAASCSLASLYLITVYLKQDATVNHIPFGGLR